MIQACLSLSRGVWTQLLGEIWRSGTALENQIRWSFPTRYISEQASRPGAVWPRALQFFPTRVGPHFDSSKGTARRSSPHRRASKTDQWRTEGGRKPLKIRPIGSFLGGQWDVGFLNCVANQFHIAFSANGRRRPNKVYFSTQQKKFTHPCSGYTLCFRISRIPMTSNSWWRQNLSLLRRSMSITITMSVHQDNKIIATQDLSWLTWDIRLLVTPKNNLHCS